MIRDRDWVGRRVLLLRTIRTSKGFVFNKGRVLEVYGTWRGMFHLHSLRRGDDGCREAIRRVHPRGTLVLVDESDLSAPGSLDDWTPHPQDARYFYRGQVVRLKTDILRDGNEEV